MSYQPPNCNNATFVPQQSFYFHGQPATMQQPMNQQNVPVYIAPHQLGYPVMSTQMMSVPVPPFTVAASSKYNAGAGQVQFKQEYEHQSSSTYNAVMSAKYYAAAGQVQSPIADDDGSVFDNMTVWVNPNKSTRSDVLKNTDRRPKTSKQSTNRMNTVGSGVAIDNGTASDRMTIRDHPSKSNGSDVLENMDVHPKQSTNQLSTVDSGTGDLSKKLIMLAIVVTGGDVDSAIEPITAVLKKEFMDSGAVGCDVQAINPQALNFDSDDIQGFIEGIESLSLLESGGSSGFTESEFVQGGVPHVDEAQNGMNDPASGADERGNSSASESADSATLPKDPLHDEEGTENAPDDTDFDGFNNLFDNLYHIDYIPDDAAGVGEIAETATSAQNAPEAATIQQKQPSKNKKKANKKKPAQPQLTKAEKRAIEEADRQCFEEARALNLKLQNDVKSAITSAEDPLKKVKAFDLKQKIAEKKQHYEYLQDYIGKHKKIRRELKANNYERIMLITDDCQANILQWFLQYKDTQWQPGRREVESLLKEQLLKSNDKTVDMQLRLLLREMNDIIVQDVMALIATDGSFNVGTYLKMVFDPNRDEVQYKGVWKNKNGDPHKKIMDIPECELKDKVDAYIARQKQIRSGQIDIAKIEWKSQLEEAITKQYLEKKDEFEKSQDAKESYCNHWNFQLVVASLSRDNRKSTISERAERLMEYLLKLDDEILRFDVFGMTAMPDEADNSKKIAEDYLSLVFDIVQ